jgi:hypothetical protein
MRYFLVLTLLASVCCGPLQANDGLPWDTSPSTAWPAGPGRAEFELRGDYLKDFGIEVVQGGRIQSERLTTAIQINTGRLWAWVPYGNFEAFNAGQLEATSDFVLRRGDFEADFTELVLVPSQGRRRAQLLMLDRSGNHLATITHPHAAVHPAQGKLRFHSSDVQGSDWLFTQLGLPELGRTILGQLSLSLALDVPANADLSGTSPDRGGLSCQDRPFWPQDNAKRPPDRPEHLVDVELVAISTVQYQGTETATDRVKVAPSATLRSVGFGDAAWEEKFGELGPYPFEPRDQHPFLVWNMYRIDDGRIEQLGASGVKHAWLTINFRCAQNGGINCGNNNILWPGCEDVYGAGTNDNNRDQGPRDEIFASDGLFFSSPSFFDPGGIGSQTNDAGSFENRLMINDTDLQAADADYFLDSWYVVMHDIDIWNSMGYHSIDPSPVGGGWGFGPLGPFTSSTPLSEWIPFPATDPNESHVSVVVDGPTPDAAYPANQPDGHFRVLARAEDLGNGKFLYRYAVMNFDFDQGFSEFEVPLPEGAVVSDTYMGGPYDVLTTPWSVAIEDTAVRFTAPDGEKLPWFTLYNFEVTVDRAPADGAAVALKPFAEADSRPRARHIPVRFVVDAIAPAAAQAAEIFEDRFEAVQ